MTTTYLIGTPIDWTNGTGAMPASTVTLPANPQRVWFYVQNQDTTALSVTYTAQKASDGTATTVKFYVPVAASSGAAGGVEVRSGDGLLAGQIVVTGTSSSKVAIVELVNSTTAD